MSRSKVAVSDPGAVAVAVREPGPNASLHTLAAHLRVATSESQVRGLLVGLADALAVTAADVRVPHRPCVFELPCKGRRLEQLWARRLWDQFGPRGRKEMVLVGASWLIGLQAPVTPGRSGRRFREQHFVGVDSCRRLPAVLELTTLRRQSSVPAAIVDGVVRAIVLQKAWPNGLRGEWAGALSAAGFGEPSLPTLLDEVPVAIVAPLEDWRVLADRRHPDRVFLSTVALQAIHGLVDGLARRGFRVTLGEVDDFMGRVHVWPYTLPRIGRAAD
jgi:hypothetical protein